MAHTIAVPDGAVAVTDRGHGPPVLLVHGGTGTGEHDWGDVAHHLGRRGRRVVVVDVRGHGASRNDGGPLTTRRFAADLLHVLRSLGIGRSDLVGFSLGANTVLELLCRRPDVGTRAVLVGGSATGSPARVRAISDSPEWPPALRALRHAVDPSPDYWYRLRGHLLADWEANTEVPARRLARVRCPVLVVAGVHDPIQRVDVARHLASTLPEGRLALVEDAGHAVHHDRPDRFLELLDDALTPASTRDVRRKVLVC